MAFGVAADLGTGTIKFTGLTAAIATLGGTFENLCTSFNDVIIGNAASWRAAAEMRSDGGLDTDTVQGSFPQARPPTLTPWSPR